MKKKLNLLCALVFVVLVSSIALSFTGGFSAGFDSVEETSKAGTTMPVNIRITPLRLYPKNPTATTDSVVNTINGEKTPICFSQIVAYTKSENGEIISPALMVSSMLLTISTICAFVAFFRFVLRINRSNIFDWKNVRILRRLGIYLCIMFVGDAWATYSSLIEASRIIAIEGYGINWNDGVSGLTLQLLLGLMCLISAEIFAIGLRMKEEQDLTI
jgi:hypothetical protein